MGKLINGKVRFNAKPQPFIEMSDKFYFLGQGYTKYSLSPIKNDFSKLSCDPNMFTSNANYPIAKSILNMNCYNTNNDITFANVLGSEDMILVDSVDSTIEYFLKNPLGEDSTRLVKYDRKTGDYIYSNVINLSSRRASIIGQNDKYLYVTAMVSSTLVIYCVVKSTMSVSALPGGQYWNTNGSYVFQDRKLYEDNEIILIGCITSGAPGNSTLVPSLIVINKTINSVSCKVVLSSSKDGEIRYNAALQNRLSTSSNVVKKRGDIYYSYFVGSRVKDGVTSSVLFKLEYNRFKDTISLEDFTKADGFDIEHINYKSIANRGHLILEVSSKGDIDTLTIFDGFKNINMYANYPLNNLVSGITTFKIDTFKHKIEKHSYVDISDSDYMYSTMKLSDDTIALITPSNVIYCTKDKIDEVYRVMNKEPIPDSRFIMKDSDYSLWNLTSDGSVFKLDGAKRRVDMYCTFEKNKYEYRDREINTNVLVGIKDYITGKMVKGNVILKLSDNCVFRDNDTNTIKITTSDVIDVKLPVIIKASGALTTQIDVDFDTEG